ncbi:hypothetical protein [Staphylococcus aureus]|uniref:hypothetical protein n=1 Tax=Staphylococcus aureus TaxID=1280 RepID=UPI00129F58F0|nr:hypothetical protein [Staphylococcus aureus]AYD82585.1 hypothetical protein ART_00116 [Achromobacter phage vB_Ade_ART]MBD4209904.1 hypothetical protein [Xanthomonas citri pv. citri]
MKSLEERRKARAAARNQELAEQAGEQAKPDYRKFKKAELQQMLRDREFDVDDKDTVADLIAALEADDEDKANQE